MHTKKKGGEDNFFSSFFMVSNLFHNNGSPFLLFFFSQTGAKYLGMSHAMLDSYSHICGSCLFLKKKNVYRVCNKSDFTYYLGSVWIQLIFTEN